MNISLKILMASVLINAVNLNPSYCMEEKNESQTEVQDETELYKTLGMKYSFEKMHDKYINAKAANEIVAEFCNILLGKKNDHLNNNCLNLEIILHNNCNNELYYISAMLRNIKICNHLKRLLVNCNDSLLNTIYQR